MKIYILNINKLAQPDKNNLKYPIHNIDYGVEQDFLIYLNKNKNIVTTNPNEADWHYLPAFWTRWHLNHNFASFGTEKLESIIQDCIIDDNRTFTICQYDDGPIINIGNTIQFLASRKTEYGFDIPLLCKKHSAPWFTPNKKYISSFAGRLDTHPIRLEINTLLKNNKNFFIHNGNMGTRRFVKNVLESYSVLAPRGYGGSSFRFYEAMQLGVVPILIGDIDTRPFKKYLPWNEISVFAKNSSNLLQIFENFSIADFSIMSMKALKVYNENLTFQNWCRFVLMELNDIKYGIK